MRSSKHENVEFSILDMKSTISVNIGPKRQRIKTQSRIINAARRNFNERQ